MAGGRNFWSEQELQILHDGIKAGKLASHIAEDLPNRSPKGCINKAWELGLSFKQRNVASRKVLVDDYEPELEPLPAGLHIERGRTFYVAWEPRQGAPGNKALVQITLPHIKSLEQHA